MSTTIDGRELFEDLFLCKHCRVWVREAERELHDPLRCAMRRALLPWWKRDLRDLFR